MQSDRMCDVVRFGRRLIVKKSSMSRPSFQSPTGHVKEKYPRHTMINRAKRFVKGQASRPCRSRMHSKCSK